MIVTKLNQNIRCDMGGCEDVAVYSFSLDGELRTQINLCERCLRDMYAEIGKIVVPKGIDNMLNKKKKKERVDEETVL